VTLPAVVDAAALQGVAMDLDRTILPRSLELTDRLVSAVATVRETGITPIIATGRMFRSARPFAQRLRLDTPMICYQGALVADPVTGEWLLHRPMGVPIAREVLAELGGYHVNVYVDDELYVESLNADALEYARHSKLEPRVVGPLLDWLTQPTTKLVVVDEPLILDRLQVQLRERFGDRLFIAKSLPEFLEVAEPEVSKGSGLHWVCERLGIDPGRVIAFGDGANDIELLQEAGVGVAVEDADPALLPHAAFTVPGVEEDGVAGFLEELATARRVDSAP
jgi:Cof subfamily protein (haloacid dehalogenase superfamily)